MNSNLHTGILIYYRNTKQSRRVPVSFLPTPNLTTTRHLNGPSKLSFSSSTPAPPETVIFNIQNPRPHTRNLSPRINPHPTLFYPPLRLTSKRSLTSYYYHFHSLPGSRLSAVSPYEPKSGYPPRLISIPTDLL